MGRKRRLTSAELFSAMERVMREHGPLGITIDAVAKAAGVSKATVLYDHSSKTELLLAFLTDLFQRKREALDECAQTSADPERAWLEALVMKMGLEPADGDGFSAMLVSEALKPSSPCRSLLQDAARADLERMSQIAPNRQAAVLAHLALQGLVSGSAFGATPLAACEREGVLQAIIDLVCSGQVRASPTPMTPKPESDASQSGAPLPSCPP